MKCIRSRQSLDRIHFIILEKSSTEFITAQHNDSDKTELPETKTSSSKVLKSTQKSNRKYTFRNITKGTKTYLFKYEII